MPPKRKLQKGKHRSFPTKKVRRLETPPALAEPAVEGKVPDDGLSTTQLCRALEWFLHEDWSRQRWWQVCEKLQEQARELPYEDAANQQTFATEFEALEELRRRATNVVLREHLHLGKQESKSSDQLWARKMVKEGTLRDRFTALELLIENCPVPRISDLRRLFLSASKHNRTEKLMCVDHCKNIVCSKFLLPNERALRSLEEQATDLFIVSTQGEYKLRTPTKDGVHLRLLLFVMFEDQLKSIIEAFVKTLDALSRDTVAACRKKCLEVCGDILLTKPEQEGEILKIMVQCLGDLDPKVASLASFKLANLLMIHPGMKIDVAYRVEQLIWSQRISLMAMKLRNGELKSQVEIRNKRKIKENSQAKSELGPTSTRKAHQAVYNGVLFLSEMKYSAKLDPPQLPHEMLTRFWRMLKMMLRPLEDMEKQQRATTNALLKNCGPKKDKRNQDMNKPVGKKKALEASDATSRPQLINYIYGLGHTTEGSSILRYLLGGIRRLIPFLDKKVILDQMAHSEKTSAKVNLGITSAVVADDAKANNIVSQLFSLCHNISSWATKVHGWDLLYALMKMSGGVSATYLSNLHSQLRDIGFIESRSKMLMIRLVIKISADAEHVDLSSRVALLRRLISVVVFSDNQPELGRELFDLLIKLFQNDVEVLRWWKMECEESQEKWRFDPMTYNVSLCRADSSPPWESLLLARCLAFGDDSIGEAENASSPSSESSIQDADIHVAEYSSVESDPENDDDGGILSELSN